YLVFNEGYAATEGELLRAELGDEAIRLARLVDRLLPGDEDVRALLALMLLQHARRAARTDDMGDIVLLEDQDRSRWDHAMSDERRRTSLLGTVPDCAAASLSLAHAPVRVRGVA